MEWRPKSAQCYLPFLRIVNLLGEVGGVGWGEVGGRVWWVGGWVGWVDV